MNIPLGRVNFAGNLLPLLSYLQCLQDTFYHPHPFLLLLTCLSPSNNNQSRIYQFVLFTE